MTANILLGYVIFYFFVKLEFFFLRFLFPNANKSRINKLKLSSSSQKKFLGLNERHRFNRSTRHIYMYKLFYRNRKGKRNRTKQTMVPSGVGAPLKLTLAGSLTYRAKWANEVIAKHNKWCRRVQTHMRVRSVVRPLARSLAQANRCGRFFL